MNQEYIQGIETTNDGQSVFLLYDEVDGCYKAFGHSAYYADMVADGVLCYSETLKMPFMIIGDKAVMDLRRNMTVVEHRKHEFYRFKTKVRIGDAGYERWKESIAKKNEH